MHHAPVFGNLPVESGSFGSVIDWRHDEGYESYSIDFSYPDGRVERKRVHKNGRTEILSQQADIACQ